MQTHINQGKKCHMCNKFLTLGFGCEHEEVLEFQGRTFSPVFQLGVFTHDDNGNKEKE